MYSQTLMSYLITILWIYFIRFFLGSEARLPSVAVIADPGLVSFRSSVSHKLKPTNVYCNTSRCTPDSLCLRFEGVEELKACLQRGQPHLALHSREVYLALGVVLHNPYDPVNRQILASPPRCACSLTCSSCPPGRGSLV